MTGPAGRLVHLLALMLCFGIMGSAAARDVLRGVNFVHPLQFGAADQDKYLARIQSAGVRVIRFGMYQQDADKIVAFLKLAKAHGIAADVILHGIFEAGAPQRAYQPKAFPGQWGGPGLSHLDVAGSRGYFQQLLDRLDADGIALAGLELENEINMSGYNPDFPLPGEGRVLGLDDLYHDPEGQEIAKGFSQYMKVLAALKAVRDQSKLNRRTPLLPTSLVDIVDEGAWSKRYDGVSVGATFAFFRTHGLDQLVDAYNLHTYPWADHPGDKAAAIHRMRRLQALVDPICASGAKPCWITEWGFTYAGKSCPAPEERGHAMLVGEMMGDFAQLAQEGRMTGLIYYSWTGDPPFDLDRCGALSESGRLAIAPLR